MYFNCDVCDTFRCCKGSVEQSGGNHHEAQSMKSTDTNRTIFKKSWKQMKKKLKEQKKLVRLVIKLGLVMFVLVLFVACKWIMYSFPHNLGHQ